MIFQEYLVPQYLPLTVRVLVTWVYNFKNDHHDYLIISMCSIYVAMVKELSNGIIGFNNEEIKEILVTNF